MNNGSSSSSKLLDVDRINEVGVSIEGPPPEQHIHGFGRVESVPENVPVPIRAGSLHRKASYLPSIPPDPTAPTVHHTKSCKIQINKSDEFIFIGKNEAMYTVGSGIGE